MGGNRTRSTGSRSHPSRVRGLKLIADVVGEVCASVAPFTGAWIEIQRDIVDRAPTRVAPFTGAWIEITSTGTAARCCIVAPFTGAWIEILRISASSARNPCRTLHGCVD